jgi:hypothetical protein
MALDRTMFLAAMAAMAAGCEDVGKCGGGDSGTSNCAVVHSGTTEGTPTPTPTTEGYGGSGSYYYSTSYSYSSN